MKTGSTETLPIGRETRLSTHFSHMHSPEIEFSQAKLSRTKIDSTVWVHCHYCLGTLPLLYGHTVNTLWVHCHYCVGTLPLLCGFHCHYSMSTPPLLCGYTAITVWIHFNYCMGTLSLLCWYIASTVLGTLLLML